MPSKRSFFNRTLFRKNLSRFWPLWGGISLVGAMLPLYLMLALIQQAEPIERQHFAEGMYQLAAGFVPAFTCCYAILCAMAVWGYLYNARAVGMMHTLPVDRTCLLVTNTLSGLAMVLIPYAVVGAMVTHGYLDDLDNAILVTVSNDSVRKARELRSSVVGDIEKLKDEYNLTEPNTPEAVKEMLKAGEYQVQMAENCGMDGERLYGSLEEMPEKAGYYSLIIVRDKKEERDT